MTPSEIDRRPTIVVTIDGLRAAALGAYGQTAYETPAFDAIAATGTVYDWCYAPTPEPADLLQGCLANAHRSEGNLGEWLLTDAPQFAAAAEQRFERVERISNSTPDELAGSIATTQQGAEWLRFAEMLVESPPLPGQSVWFHTHGLRGPWDAPRDLLDSLIDEDDPPVDLDLCPPSGEIPSDDDPDARFAAGCRYAMQVRTLDACLESWIEVADAVFEGEPWRLVLAGVRGFPLGEHGPIGGSDARLFSEQQHVPLLVREAPLAVDSKQQFVRERVPVRLDQALLAQIEGRQDELETNESAVWLTAGTGAAVLCDADWLLRRPGPAEHTTDHADPNHLSHADDLAELYVKPDDRWEQNDIATLERERVEQMLAELASRESDVASVRPDA